MLARLKAWLRSLPLQRRVAYLTTVAVALAVAVTSVAGYVTLRVSLYNALDNELIDTASSLAAVPVAQDIRTLGGLTERALRAANVSVAAVRADGEIFLRSRRARSPGARRRGAGRRPAADRLLGAVRGVDRRRGVPHRRRADHRSGQLRAGARPAAGTDQRHPQLAVAGLDHLRRVAV